MSNQTSNDYKECGWCGERPDIGPDVGPACPAEDRCDYYKSLTDSDIGSSSIDIGAYDD